MLVTTKSIANVVNVLLGRGGGGGVCVCVCMARPTKSVSQIRVPTPGKRGGEGRGGKALGAC